MSNKALNYVMELLEQTSPIDVPPGARAVLWPAADRAHRATGQTYAGQWLSRAAGLSPGSVRRYLHDFERRGWIRLDYANGTALRITFPVVAGLELAPPNTGRIDEQGAFHPSFCACPECVSGDGDGVAAVL